MWQNKSCARPAVTKRDVDLFTFLTIIDREYFVLGFCILDKLASVTSGGPREASLSVLMITMKMGAKDRKKRERTRMISIRAIAS